jgi:[ribosomal protein S18]-alanine N-acetyltransferase
MKGIAIRDYCPEDYSDILTLWSLTGIDGAQRGDNQEIIEHSIKLGGKLIVAELSKKQIVGTSWITFDGRRLHLHHFGVHPEYQRKGIGTLLTRETLSFAKAKGFQIKLEVHQTNLPAIALYKKHGFTYLGDYDVYIIRDVKGPEI